jgi:hypothetical protein
VNVNKYRKKPRRQVEPDLRPLRITMRIVVTKRMTARVCRALLDRAVQTGHVPAGIEIHWLNWEKGEGGEAQEGTVLPSDLRRSLDRFYGAITKGKQRFAKVAREGEA